MNSFYTPSKRWLPTLCLAACLLFATAGCKDKTSANSDDNIPSNRPPLIALTSHNTEKQSDPSPVQINSPNQAADNPSNETSSPSGFSTTRSPSNPVVDSTRNKGSDPAKPSALAARTDKAEHAAEAKPTDSAASEPNKGANVTGEGFSTWAQAAKSYQVGQPASITVVLTAKDPYKCNDKYPHRFKLDAPGANITYPQDTVRGMHVTPKRSTLTIPFVPTAAGSATISGTLHFSVCTDERCLMEKRQIAVTIQVN